MNKWLVSDTHFFHEKMLTFEDGRPEFSSVEEMNSVMIDRWNSVVKPGDRVYHLGDVAAGAYQEEALGKLLRSLHGRKKLIVGNHDPLKLYGVGGWFKEVVYWNNLKDFRMVLSHMPLHAQTLGEKPGRTFNIHGHIHRKESPTLRHYCVCVEQINYTPVNLEELRDKLFAERAELLEVVDAGIST